MKSLLRVVPIWSALMLTVALLVLVGMGEARRNYYLFRLDTATVQSESMLRVLKPDLENGTALDSISGLPALTRNLCESDSALLDVTVFGESGQPVVQVHPEIRKEALQETLTPFKAPIRDKSYVVKESGRFLLVSKSVDTRFGQAGSVELLLDKGLFLRQLTPSFWRMGGCAAVLMVLLYGVMVFASRRYRNHILRLKRVIQVCYFLVFLGCAGVIVKETLSVYTTAVEYKSQALGKFLARRLSMASGAGIDFNDLSGINDLLAEFRKEHEEICAVDLLVDGQATYSASSSALASASTVDAAGKNTEDVITHTISLTERTADGSTARLLQLLVKVPNSVIREAVQNGAVNLLVLMLACSLLANLILEIGVTQLSARLENVGKKAPPTAEQALASMQAAYLSMGLINALTLPFLAPMLKEITGEVTSLPFTLFFLCFAVFMIPAGKLAEKGYTRHLLIFGTFAEAIGCLMVAFFPSMGLLTVGRSLSGLGQGIFLIGFQSFIISVTGKGERTQGQALKVIIRYTVLMAGSAIGALMYVFLDSAVVFGISGVMGAVTLLYVLFALPDPNAVPKEHGDTIQLRKSETQTSRYDIRPFLRIFRDREFMVALLLNGIPSKVAIAGIVMFGIPLLMADRGIPSESIGRYLMLYYVTCMFVSRWSAKVADASGKTKGLLTWGAILGGVGFALLGGLTSGLVTIPGIENWMVVLLAASIVLGGTSNGFTAAPILTHIGKTDAAKEQGQKTMVAVYSFAERFGHIAGSALIAYGAALTGDMGTAILYFGVISLVLGVFFHLLARKA